MGNKQKQDLLDVSMDLKLTSQTIAYIRVSAEEAEVAEVFAAAGLDATVFQNAVATAR